MDLPRNTIIVAEDEELVSILERIHTSRFKELFVVVPGGAIIGRSALNLKILKKEAEQHDKTLRIAAQDPGLQRLAQGLGIAWEGDVARFWKRVEEYLGDPRLRYASEYVEMSDIVATTPKDDLPDAGPVEIEPEVEEELKEIEKEILEEPNLVVLEESAENKKVSFKTSKSSAAEKETPEEKLKDKEVVETITRLYNRMDESMKKSSKKKPKAVRASSERRSWMILGIFGVVAVGLFVLVASVVLPRADVLLTPRSEMASIELIIIADANRSGIDTENSVIPGQMFEVIKTAKRTFPSTGERNVEDRAGGFITVYNQFSSEPQTLVKTTRFLSNSGKLFRTVETVVIPGAIIESGQIIASSVQVAIQADEPGPDFNIGPSRFNIPGFEGTPKFDAFYGESNIAMEGGAVGTVRIVTEDDIEGATSIVEQSMLKEVETELDNKIPIELMLVDDAREVEVMSANSSVGANEIADQFEIEIEVIARAFVFREKDIGELVNERLLKTITAGTKEVRSDSLELSIKPEVVNFEEGTLTMTIDAKELIAWIIDDDILREEFRGVNKDGVQEVLADHPEVTAIEVTFWPFWVDTIPDNADRIDIEIQ